MLKIWMLYSGKTRSLFISILYLISPFSLWSKGLLCDMIKSLTLLISYIGILLGEIILNGFNLRQLPLGVNQPECVCS